jgi:erythritol kinase
MNHGFGDLIRAVFNGLAFAPAIATSRWGRMPGKVRLTGGAARSASLRSILGGALGAEIQTIRTRGGGGSRHGDDCRRVARCL